MDSGAKVYILSSEPRFQTAVRRAIPDLVPLAPDRSAIGQPRPYLNYDGVLLEHKHLLPSASSAMRHVVKIQSTRDPIAASAAISRLLHILAEGDHEFQAIVQNPRTNGLTRIASRESLTDEQYSPASDLSE